MSLKGDAESVLSYTKRAYNAETLEEIHLLAKKAMIASESLGNEARHSNCFDVMDNAQEVHSLTRKIVNSTEMEEVKPLTEKALKAARHARSSVEFYKDE